MRMFFVAGEPSGDRLGAALIAALRAEVPDLALAGVGGEAMAAEGLVSLFPMSDLSVMGIGPVLARLPMLLRRIREAADAIIRERPDVAVLIDSPDFTHRVARRVRAVAPQIPLVFYVSPTVWAWRPGRAAKMKPYCDRLLAVLPFEPAVHARLGGPETVYVGHPLVDRLAGFADGRPDTAGDTRACRLLLLPGSRRSEITRLLPLFLATAEALAATGRRLDIALPTVPHVEPLVRQMAGHHPLAPRISVGEAAKYEAFRTADVALAASGTVTLELALAGVPHVVGYKLDWIGRRLRRFVHARDELADIVPLLTPGLPNTLTAAAPGQTIIADPLSYRQLRQGPELPVPEFIDDICEPAAMAAALDRLIGDTPQRRLQLAAFRTMAAFMATPDGASAGVAAARAVLDLAKRRTSA